jgi:hypothetical protein
VEFCCSAKVKTTIVLQSEKKRFPRTAHSNCAEWGVEKQTNRQQIVSTSVINVTALED